MLKIVNVAGCQTTVMASNGLQWWHYGASENMIVKNQIALDIVFNALTGQDLVEHGIYDLIILDQMCPIKRMEVL